MKIISKEDLEKLTHNKQILFACYCAEQVIHLVKKSNKPICLRAIQVAYLSLEEKVSKEECYAAAYAAADAAYANANANANAAADAAYAAAYAAYAAYAAAADAAYAAAYAAAKNQEQIIKAQWDFYDQLLNGDKYFEEIVLKEQA